MQAGRQPARATNLQFGTAETGTVQVAVTFEITDGDDRGEYITWTGSLTEKAAPHALKALAVCGAPMGKTLDQLTIDDLQSFVSLVVEYETHEGKARPRVKWVNRPGGGGFTMKHPIEGAELRLLGAEWKASFDQTKRYEPLPVPEATARPAESRPAEGSAPDDERPEPTEAHPFAPQGTDADIPF